MGERKVKAFLDKAMRESQTKEYGIELFHEQTTKRNRQGCPLRISQIGQFIAWNESSASSQTDGRKELNVSSGKSIFPLSSCVLKASS